MRNNVRRKLYITKSVEAVFTPGIKVNLKGGRGATKGDDANLIVINERERRNCNGEELKYQSFLGVSRYSFMDQSTGKDDQSGEDLH